MVPLLSGAQIQALREAELDLAAADGEAAARQFAMLVRPDGGRELYLGN